MTAAYLRTSDIYICFLLSVQWIPRSKNSSLQHKSYPFRAHVLKMIARKGPIESVVRIVRF